jgi:hypothetical protein
MEPPKFEPQKNWDSSPHVDGTVACSRFQRFMRDATRGVSLNHARSQSDQ